MSHRSMPDPSRHTVSAALSIYLRPQVLVMWLLGFSAGLPLALSGNTLSIWMADRGVNIETIGLLSLAGLPYAVKFLWAPLVDVVEIPVLGAWLGRRRSWMLASQIALMGAILFLGTRDPVTGPWAIGLGALLVATASATQDIVIDAYRIERLQGEELAAGVASYAAAYRVGLLVSGAGVIGLTAWLEARGFAKEEVWRIGYALAAAFVLVGVLAVLLAKEPRSASPGVDAAVRGHAEVARAFVGAIGAFLSRRLAFAVLAFVMLYRLCDAMAGAMTGPFVLALGYDKATYAAIVNGVGLIATVVGGFAGGLLAMRLPIVTCVWIGSLLQMASNLVFVWLAALPPSVPALTLATVIENICGGIGSVIFGTYLSMLCSIRAHTATHYAMLTATAAAGRILVATASGYAAAGLGWQPFFIVTTAMAVPGLLLLAWMQARGHFDGLGEARR